MPSLSEIQREVKWRYTEQDDEDHIAVCIAGECGEMCNLVKKLTRVQHNPNLKRANEFNKEEMIKKIAYESIDTIFYIAVQANKYGINLDDYWIEKNKINSKKYGIGYPE